MMHCNERKERERRGKRDAKKQKHKFLKELHRKEIFFLPPARITGRFRYHAEKKHAIQIKPKKKEIIQNLISNELTQTKETTQLKGGCVTP